MFNVWVVSDGDMRVAAPDVKDEKAVRFYVPWI